MANTMHHTKLKTMRLIFIIILFLAQGCGTSEIRFYTEYASLLKQQEHEKILNEYKKTGVLNKKDFGSFVQTGHMITNGTGSVISIRKIIKPFRSLFYTDNVFYQNLTIYLPHLQEETGEISISENNSIAYYSAGNLAFFDITSCYGYAKEGNIKYKKLSPKQIEIDFSTIIDLFDNSNFDDESCESKQISIEENFISRPVEEANIGLYFHE